jgi:hypothetical protein
VGVTTGEGIITILGVEGNDITAKEIECERPILVLPYFQLMNSKLTLLSLY